MILHNTVQIAAVSLGFLGIGFAGGLLIGKRLGEIEAVKLSNDVLDAELLAQEEALMKRFKVGRYAEPATRDDRMRASLESYQTDPEARRKVDAAFEAYESYKTPLFVSDTSGKLDDETLEKLRDKLRSYKTDPDWEKKSLDELRASSESTPVEEDHIRNVFEAFPSTPVEDGPVIITETEFGLNLDYDTECLAWYPGDRVLATDDDKVVDDPDIFVGLNNLNHLTAASPILYVKNDEKQMVFEIAYQMGTYAETVLGIESEPHEERTARRARKPRDE